MRAAPGFAPRAIARLSRRIDIAKTLFTASPKVAEIGELRVNPGAVRILVMARRESGKWVGSRLSAADTRRVAFAYLFQRGRRLNPCQALRPNISGSFSGRVNNRPRTVHSIEFGQTLAFTQRDIVDWLYMDGDKRKGSFTTCAILKHELRRDADATMKHYGLECDF